MHTQNSSLITHCSSLPPTPYFPLFPHHRLTLLIGDPGTGKSLLATHLAARRSLRSPLPPHAPNPNPVPPIEDPVATDLRALEDHPGLTIFCSRDDDEQTLTDRLTVANGGTPADTRFLRFLNLSLVPTTTSKLTDYGTTSKQTLSPLLEALTQLANQHEQLGLLILDPLPAFLENLDASNQPALIRSALQPLLQFAENHNLSILGISHLAKNRRPHNPLFHAASSFAYTALARSVLLLTHDSLSHNRNRRLLIPLKNSFANPACAYGITLHTQPIPGINIPFPYLTFDPDPIHHPSLHTQYFSAFSPPPSDEIPDSLLQLAQHFLRTTLADGPIPSARLLAEAHSLGISTSTFLRARDSLPTHHYREKKIWFTHLPHLAAPEYFI